VPTKPFELGLVNRLVPAGDLLASVHALANDIEVLSPLSIRACLKAVIEGSDMPLPDGLDLENSLFHRCSTQKTFVKVPLRFWKRESQPSRGGEQK
jgi:enoyl-CoA hydratase